MATRRTLQRQLLSPSYSPSASAEAGMFEQQASGMSQLASSLNQMSNFFYKEMETRAKEEGEMYGAANPITIEELQKAIKTGEDVTDRLGYGLKGRAARSTAFGNVMTEIELQASRDYVTLIEQAKQNDQSYEDVIDGLDAITVGYTDMLKGVSPENHIIMKGALSKLSSGHLKSYLSDMAEKQQQINESTVAAQLINSEQNIPTLVESILDDFKSEDQMAKELRQNRELQTNLSLNTAISKGGYTGPQIINMRKDLDKRHLDTYKSKISSIALKTESVGDLASNIVKGKKTGNAKIDAMLRQFTPEDKLDLVNNMQKARKDFFNAIDEEEEKLSNKTKGLFNDTVLLVEEAIDTNNELQFIDGMTQLRTIDRNNSKINQLVLEKRKYQGIRRTSDVEILKDLRNQANSDILQFSELEINRSKLSLDDYTALRKEIETDFENNIPLIISELKGMEGYRPILDEEISKGHPYYEKQFIYDQLANKLNLELQKAKEKNIQIDLRKIAKDELNPVRDEIKKMITTTEKSELLAIYNQYKKDFENFAKQDKNFNFNENATDIQKYKAIMDYLNTIESNDIKVDRVRKFKNRILIKQLPQMIRFIKENPNE
ncbi:hypothetical protein [uncultured Mediterranean phage uvMED]|nr:hypothetical protein [uncultured Mediterranean phage uvMED]